MGERTKDTCPEICLAFVWHQHQPYYWELSSDTLVFPWVRLHATKDYYDMASRLERYPKIHQTFNLVPSLMEQLEAYAQGRTTDRYLVHSRIPASELNREQKVFILERFFDAHDENLIHPYPRYKEIKEQRDKQGIEKACERMKVQDFLDLQTWFNLAWIDPRLRESDPTLSDLARKGRGFTEDDKQAVLRKHIDIMAGVVPLHRRLQDEGRIEVTTTPFFHPILPLLCDTDEARVALPDIQLPSNRFEHPEDAREQVRLAVEFYEERFGRRARGMWPAEGSVSPAAAALFAEAGVEWIATDEEVLGRSLGLSLKRSDEGLVEDPRTLYTPYRLKTESGELSLIFRDRVLSDLIGFHYQRAEPHDAASDFLSRIERIAHACGPTEAMPPLIAVILDGENCWEYYREDGNPFLDAVYERLGQHTSIRCVTVSEYLDEAAGRGPGFSNLDHLFSGSWINHSFRIWIGSDEDNRSWDLLWEARNALGEVAERGEPLPSGIDKAWKEIYIAEGSDWNWWYGDEHQTTFAEAFDRLYRNHLRNVYRFIGREPPAHLDVPIQKEIRPKIAQLPGQTFTPTIDGQITDYFEWCGAGRYQVVGAGEAMHAGEARIRWIYFGFDMDRLYVRADFRSRADFPRENEELILLIPGKESRRVVHRLAPGEEAARFERQTDDGWREEGVKAQAALGSIWEVAVPWSALPGVEPGRAVPFVLQILREGVEVERVPRTAPLETVRPTTHFDEEMWVV